MLRIKFIILFFLIFSTICNAQFSPINIDSLLCWYKGDIGYTLNGISVTKWTDYINQDVTANDMIQKGIYQTPTFTFPNLYKFGGNGTDSQLGLASSSTISITDNTVSMVCRMKFIANTSYEGVFAKSANASIFQYGFVKSNLEEVSFRIDGANEAISTTILSGWHTVIGTYDGSFIRIYVDDTICEDSLAHTGNIDFVDSALRFGVIGGTLNDYSGWVTDGLIYDIALTPEHITKIMAYNWQTGENIEYNRYGLWGSFPNFGLK